MCVCVLARASGDPLFLHTCMHTLAARGMHGSISTMRRINIGMCVCVCVVVKRKNGFTHDRSCNMAYDAFFAFIMVGVLNHLIREFWWQQQCEACFPPLSRVGYVCCICALNGAQKMHANTRANICGKCYRFQIAPSMRMPLLMLILCLCHIR